MNNFFVKGLVDAKKASVNPCDVFCDVCSEDGDEAGYVPAATMYCTSCGQKLCTQCSKPHKRIPGGAHQVVAITNEAGEFIPVSQARFCNQHIGNRLDLFCNDCRINVCLVCVVSKHRTHEYSDVEDLSKQFSKVVESDVEQLLDRENSILKDISRMNSQEKEFFDSLQDIERTMQENATKVKKYIDVLVQQWLENVTKHKTEASKTIAVAKNELEVASLGVQSFTRYTQELLKSGQPCDITQAFHDVRARASELLKQEVKIDLTNKLQIPKSLTMPNDILGQLLTLIVSDLSGE
jgi:hypothetical protein